MDVEMGDDTEESARTARVNAEESVLLTPMSTPSRMLGQGSDIVMADCATPTTSRFKPTSGWFVEDDNQFTTGPGSSSETEGVSRESIRLGKRPVGQVKSEESNYPSPQVTPMKPLRIQIPGSFSPDDLENPFLDSQATSSSHSESGASRNSDQNAVDQKPPSVPESPEETLPSSTSSGWISGIISFAFNLVFSTPVVSRRQSTAHVPESPPTFRRSETAPKTNKSIKSEPSTSGLLTPQATPERATVSRSGSRQSVSRTSNQATSATNPRNRTSSSRNGVGSTRTTVGPRIGPERISAMELEDSDDDWSDISPPGNSTVDNRPIEIVSKFEDGLFLMEYQIQDLRRLVKRERGEKVCGTDIVNNVGYVLAYEMGLGKTIMSIALVLSNPAPRKFAQDNGKATLVVVPNKGLMTHWQAEVKKFAPSLSVCYYDSRSKSLDIKSDVVVCTYAQVQQQRASFLENLDKDEEEKKKLAPIFCTIWFRVIADEAHTFRNPESKGAEAMWSIEKVHGLCLSGTPTQNSPLDFYPLYRFLNVKFESINDLKVYRTKIYAKKQKGPIKTAEGQRIYRTLGQSFVIVRRKVDPETGITLSLLPTRTDHIVEVNLSQKEIKVYEHVRALKLSIYTHIMRLRQVCDHPMLVAAPLKIRKDNADAENEEKEGSENDPVVDPQKPLESLPRSVFSHSYISSKLRAVLAILQTRPKGRKTILFTHFTSMIPSLVNLLDNYGIGWTDYTGKDSDQHREGALKEIAEDDRCTVIIVSIMAGGVGLNITSCNTVIILEPWWNPYAEEQAISRTHRIGQKLPVEVYTLVVNNTLEEYIVKTQRQKRDTMTDLYGTFPEPTRVEQEQWLAACPRRGAPRR